MLDIVKRDFNEEDRTYHFELTDGTRLHYDNWNGEGFLLCDDDPCTLYIPVKNPHPVDYYGEPDFYEVIGFEKKPMN